MRTAKHGAHSEAVGYFTKGLELLSRLPAGNARDRRELDLQMALSWSLFMARGPLTLEREPALVRARQLCEHLGDHTKLMEALVALAHLHRKLGDFELTRELAEEVLAMDQETQVSTPLAGAHYLLGVVDYSTGQFLATREHFERAVELFGDDPSDYYGAFYFQTVPNLLVGVLLLLGYPSTAFSKDDELLVAARSSSDPNSIAFNLFSYCFHHLLLRDTRMVAERAEEVVAIAIEHEMRPLQIAAVFFSAGAQQLRDEMTTELLKCAEVYRKSWSAER